MPCKVLQFVKHRAQYILKRCQHSSCIDILPQVSSALKNGKPVVALESTIITHGMPYPENLQTALQVEAIVREQGATPATIGIINGRIKVGIEKDDLVELAEMKNTAIKTSRRDFPYVLSKNLNGGTTVSGTMIVAEMVGIPIFATGGIGGVHRGAETTMDISADLTELGRTQVAVISSGVKSILDIGRTLEYLETQGVCVATYGPTTDFPAFFTSRSGLHSPYCVQTAVDAAALIHKIFELKLGSGLLLAVPIPADAEADGELIESAIKTAVREAERQNVKGKEVTPFVLKEVNRLTGGKSLQSNVALIKNNAKMAAQVAVELMALRSGSTRKTGNTSPPGNNKLQSEHGPVVIGGCNFDCIMKVQESNVKLDGRTHRGEIGQICGGVGRNMADALSRLGTKPLFVSAVGKDLYGSYLLQNMSHMVTSGIAILDNERTASYNVLLDEGGECRIGVGDMDIHNYIGKKMVASFAESLQRCPLVVMDGNIPEETIQYILDICGDHDVPVWYEPTDVVKASKPFTTDAWKNITFISPNLNELRAITEKIGVSLKTKKESSSHDALIDEVVNLSCSLLRHVTCVIVTMGKLGVVIVRKGGATTPFFKDGHLVAPESSVSARLYRPPETDIVSVSGAGDCFAAGMIAGMLRGCDELQCVSVGMSAAVTSLQSMLTVSQELKEEKMDWFSSTLYQSLDLAIRNEDRRG